MLAGRFRVAAAALALLLLPALASAQTPTPLVLNLDRDLKIIVTYPLEVKYGSTVRVLFDITAMDNVTVNRMWVRFVLVHEGGAVTYSTTRRSSRTRCCRPGTSCSSR